MTLKELDIPSLRERRNCNHKVINLEENQAFGNGWVEGGNINNEQQRRDGGAMWGTHGDWSKSFWGALKEKQALSVGEEAVHPRNDIPVSPFGP